MIKNIFLNNKNNKWNQFSIDKLYNIATNKIYNQMIKRVKSNNRDIKI